MNHSFDVEIAVEYGVLESILINHIYFWTEKNRANNRNFYNGRYWIYNSTKAFTELFPYASSKKITYALNKLIEDGILIKGNYNSKQFDRTMWYALTDKGLALCKNGKCISQNGVMHSPILSNALPQNVKCLNTDTITDNNTDTNTDNNEPFFDNPAMQSAFDDWIQYKAERHEGYKPTGLSALVTRLRNEIAQRGEAAVIEGIRYSMSQGWKGIYYPDKPKQAAHTTPPSYDIGRAEQRAKTTVPTLTKKERR